MKVWTSSSKKTLAAIRGVSQSCRILSYDGRDVVSLGNLFIDLLPVVVIVRQRVIDFRWAEGRELAKDVFDRQAATVVPNDRTDGKAASLNDRPASLNVG